ncbi:hypothetical protein JTB14_014900 [Gonioctena quinquepunctata]|nr:hypothetical protein JTB14_014900 [Gonioctena quinquepunctata]
MQKQRRIIQTEDTINDVMEKLQAMEQKYNDLLIKYDDQVSVDNELRREILKIKAKPNWEINKNEQDERKDNIIIMGIIKTIGNSLQVSLGKIRSYRRGKCPFAQKSPIKVEFE